jgi:hypothetical protein
MMFLPLKKCLTQARQAGKQNPRRIYAGFKANKLKSLYKIRIYDDGNADESFRMNTFFA